MPGRDLEYSALDRLAPAHAPMSQPRIAPEWPGACFGCSPHNPHGLHLHFERTPQGCRASHTLAGHFCGFDGVAHGGIVSTLLDEVGAWAVILHTRHMALTRHMSTRFVDRVPTGKPLQLEAWVETRSARDATTRAHIRDANGRLLAQAEAGWALASAAVVARMSGLPRESVARFLEAACAGGDGHSHGAA